MPRLVHRDIDTCVDIYMYIYIHIHNLCACPYIYIYMADQAVFRIEWVLPHMRQSLGSVHAGGVI